MDEEIVTAFFSRTAAGVHATDRLLKRLSVCMMFSRFAHEHGEKEEE